MNEIWWKKLLENERDIDVTKVDCSRAIHELSEDTQAQINRIQFDERQKLKGITKDNKLKRFRQRIINFLIIVKLCLFRRTDIRANSTTRDVAEGLECRRITVQRSTIRSEYCTISTIT